MKKIFYYFGIVFTCILLSCTVCFADVIPLNTSDIPLESIGVYQTDKKITVYEKPDSKSTVLLERTLEYNDVPADSMYAVMISSKQLGFLYVVDLSDDEDWIQVIYDKEKNLKGWVRKTDDFQFLPWVNFINLYGRKYGMCVLRNSTPEILGIFSQPDDNAQVLGKISRPKLIRLTSVEGIWMLVSVLDFSSDTTTGYVKWRDEKGRFFLFPKFFKNMI